MRSLTHPPKPAHLFIYSCEYQCVTHFRPSLSLFFFFWQTLFVVTLVFLSSTFVVIVSSSFPTRRIKPHVSDHGAVIAIFFFVGTTLAHRSHLSSSDDEQPERSVVESKGWFKLRSDFQLTARTCSFLIFLYQHYIRVSCLLMEWYIFSIISYLMYRINRLYIRFQ